MKVSLEKIHRAIAIYYKVPRPNVFKRTRRGEIIKLRQMFHFIAKELNGRKVSFNDIGSYYSDFTGHTYKHATVMNNVNKMRFYVDNYEEYREDFEAVCEVISNLKVETAEFNSLKLELVRVIMDAESYDSLKEVINGSLKSPYF